MKRLQILIVLLLFLIADAYGQRIVNFNGVIKDAQTGDPLEGISVFITERNTGTISNDTGEFLVFLNDGIYNVNISAEGYETKKFTLDLKEDKFSEITLVPSNDFKKKSDLWLKRKNHISDEVMIEKQKSKTFKRS